MTPRGCRGGGEAHAFLCPRCRAERRLSAAWSRVVPPRKLERSEPPKDDFLESVVAAVSRDRRRRLRRRTAITIAAGLVFFFLAGAAGETRSLEALRTDDAYASLLPQPPLEGLLPE